MNSQSSINTGAVGLSAVSLVPVINWMADGCSKPLPPEVSYAIAALLVAFGHLAVNIYSSKFGDKSQITSNSDPIILPTTQAVQKLVQSVESAPKFQPAVKPAQPPQAIAPAAQPEIPNQEIQS
jgi:hypothetical protein